MPVSGEEVAEARQNQLLWQRLQPHVVFVGCLLSPFLALEMGEGWLGARQQEEWVVSVDMAAQGGRRTLHQPAWSGDGGIIHAIHAELGSIIKRKPTH